MPRGTAHAPAEARRSEILDAALACFGERGYHETTVDQIAGRAGLSKGAVYWHFEGKREIFLALFDRYVDEMVARAEASRAGSAGEGLLRLADVGVLEMPDAVPLFDLFFEFMAHASRDEALRGRFERIYQRLSAVVREQYERGRADGSFRDLEPDVVARALLALGDGLMMQALTLPGVDLPRVVRDCYELVLKGVEKR